ncbi:polysaccharide biosynthesis protein [Thermoleptolyngbya oregonensis NK1-22]|uniref:Polysaccharide biosynthesis protein n=1 Tax=Thermoleptolyngbya oregonensis NK1-22 TaxID=2547457 RepID=A0AA96Y6X9_9CYAN|nr:polysaccharide biosynthesis protein [Thermoleptolyngbya oregonensis NK1-22]
MLTSADQGLTIETNEVSGESLNSGSNTKPLLRSRVEIIHDIKMLVPAGSPEPEDEQVLNQLASLTQELTKVYQAAGQLREDPFADAWNRRVHCYRDLVAEQVKGRRILVTGGNGCVGSQLIQELKTFEPEKIVCLDLLLDESSSLNKDNDSVEQFTFYEVDIRDQNELEKVFLQEKPDLVFHLAAMRLPGMAEQRVRDAVSTNIMGTHNVIRFCEKYGVKKCIFSSTGKASRYVTGEVYAATKKVCEWLFDQAAQSGSTVYGMVRFTHMLDNSAACEQFDQKVKHGKIVNIHAPDKYVCGQNVHEAVSLLLNSLVVSKPGKLEFLVCRNLGWPVETLEVALYKILQSGKNIPIYFQGSPVGYEEGFFRGNVDWDDPSAFNLLVNAIEKVSSRVDASGDFIVTPVLPCCFERLEAELAAVRKVLNDPTSADSQIKQALAECIMKVACSIYSQAPIELLSKVLNWGTDPEYLQLDGATLDSHQPTIRLFIESLSAKYRNSASHSGSHSGSLSTR